jgi:hypothetical protein
MKALLIKENGTYFLKGDGIPNPAKLNLDNCDEIFSSLAVDVDKLADEECLDDIYAVKRRYKKGFNKAMELNKDKVFTLEDMMNCWNKALKFQEHKQTLGEYIHSLQQPTEIEVEIEMENYGYCEGCRKAGMWHCAHADTCGYAETRERPKLDSEGCLILKKK